MRPNSWRSARCILDCGYSSDLAKSKISDDYGYSADLHGIPAGCSVRPVTRSVYLAPKRCGLNAASEKFSRMNDSFSFLRNLRKRRIAILLSWIVVIVMSDGVFGACLYDDYSVDAEYARSTAVVTAHVISERDVLDSEDSSFTGRTVYTIKIEASHRGKLHGIENIVSENDSGRFPMENQKSYVLFLYRQNGMFSADPCGNSGLVSERKDVVAKVRALRAKDRATHIHNAATLPPRRSF